MAVAGFHTVDLIANSRASGAAVGTGLSKGETGLRCRSKHVAADGMRHRRKVQRNSLARNF